jgi:thiamine biosynthesis lipoprotein
MLHRLPFRAMGCQMLAILEQDSETTPGILAQVPDWFEEWEQVLSRFRHDSELSRLNRTADQSVPVSPILWDVFQASLEADQSTGGLVTPTVLEAMELAGYDRPFDELHGNNRYYPVNQGYTSIWTEIHPLSMVTYDEDRHSICLPPEIRLDFGGIAKGWAAHQAAERLKTSGPALINAGGDIAISGPRSKNEPWLVGISNPFKPSQNYATLRLYSGGVATSGKDRRRWMQGAFLNHHIIDPRTGQSAVTDILTATIIAPTVMEAEAAAKSVFLLGSHAGLDWLEADSGLAGLLVLDDSQVIASQRAEEYL